MLEFLNSLTMEAVIAILGSLVTITVGIFGYLAKIKPATKEQSESLRTAVQNNTEQINKLHSRTTAAKEAALENRGELRTVTTLLKTLEKQLADHERRDIEDFKVMQQKIDKTMDIVIQILQDDKL